MNVCNQRYLNNFDYYFCLSILWWFLWSAHVVHDAWQPIHFYWSIRVFRDGRRRAVCWIPGPKLFIKSFIQHISIPPRVALVSWQSSAGMEKGFSGISLSVSMVNYTRIGNWNHINLFAIMDTSKGHGIPRKKAKVARNQDFS